MAALRKFLAAKVPLQPQPPSIAYGNQLVARIREPTSCTLVFLSGWQNTVMEVATGVAHPPGGLHHNNKISLDYTRVEVHTVNLEFMQWRIDSATLEGLVLLGDVMG